MNERVGFIGIGLMGYGMAKNLLLKGWPLTAMAHRNRAPLNDLLALGAKGVLLGRAWAYALAGGGQKGVAHLLQLIEAEIRVAMSLTGAKSAASISREMLAGPL